MRPVIGITCDYDSNAGRSALSDTYERAIYHGGGIPVLLSISAVHIPEETAYHLDGLLLSGGGDVNPLLYGCLLYTSIVFNTSLIRRRLRTPKLVMEMHQVGKQSKTDVVLCYIKERADPKLVKTIQRRLDSLEVDALTMGQESLAECILERQRFNPLPRMRYTERPDSTSAALSEGRIVLLVDNSPAAMILPTCLFDFTQQANDFYFPPFVGRCV